MEKITKEELQEILLNNQLSNDELEKIFGGAGECLWVCNEYRVPSRQFTDCLNKCLNL